MINMNPLLRCIDLGTEVFNNIISTLTKVDDEHSYPLGKVPDNKLHVYYKDRNKHMNEWSLKPQRDHLDEVIHVNFNENHYKKLKEYWRNKENLDV